MLGSHLVFCSRCGVSLLALPPVRCTQCNTDHWNNAKPCAAGLVTWEGKLLLLRRSRDPWRDHWDVTGGFCEPAEHPIDTVLREVREEVGLHVRVTGYIGTWIDTYEERVDINYPEYTFNLYYHAVPVQPPGTLHVDPNEVADVQWFPPGELPEPIAFPRHIRPMLRVWQQQFTDGRTTSIMDDYPHD